ncbi:RNA polymerase sigma factor [Streptomyces sp. NP-1717]|nr:RNA polymerase sigma factor [Streptomyces sp. NP-1717]
MERACGGLDTGERARTSGHGGHCLRWGRQVGTGWEPIRDERCIKRVRTREGTLEGGRILTVADESTVIARVRSGEREAYAELVRAHTGTALRVAVACGAGADAEDVVQSAFIKAYLSLGSFKDGASFRPWLIRIVANETRNTVRSAVRLRAVAGREAALSRGEPLIPESADPAVAAMEEERSAELWAALDELSDDHRDVVACRYLLEMNEAETAEALGWPRGTVKSRLSRALKLMGGLLAPGSEWEPRAEEAGGDGHG